MSSTTPPPPTRYPTTSSSPIPFPSPSSSASFSAASTRSSIPAKRKQVKNACVNCQKACKKCDDQRPCSRCVKYGIEDGCINSQRKERKRKTADSDDVPPRRSTSPQVSSTTRVQLNLRRLRTDEPAAFDPSTSPASASLRLSSRSGIRPFPKELLESLQDEHEHEGGVESESPVVPETTPPVVASMCPQVTEEFKTLARICSDLHTVLNQPIAAAAVSPAAQSSAPVGFRYPSPLPSSQPPFLYQRINPFSHGVNGNGIPRSTSPPPPIPMYSQMGYQSMHQPVQWIQNQQHAYQHPQYQYQQQHPQYHGNPYRPHPPPVPTQIRRSASPSEMLLTPSSPIYNSSSAQQSIGIPRDLLNRTPPEDTVDTLDGKEIHQ